MLKQLNPFPSNISYCQLYFMAIRGPPGGGFRPSEPPVQSLMTPRSRKKDFFIDMTPSVTWIIWNHQMSPLRHAGCAFSPTFIRIPHPRSAQFRGTTRDSSNWQTSYQEWLRVGPVDATATCRKDKVPIPADYPGDEIAVNRYLHWYGGFLFYGYLEKSGLSLLSRF